MKNHKLNIKIYWGEICIHIISTMCFCYLDLSLFHTNNIVIKLYIYIFSLISIFTKCIYKFCTKFYFISFTYNHYYCALYFIISPLKHLPPLCYEMNVEKIKKYPIIKLMKYSQRSTLNRNCILPYI